MPALVEIRDGWMLSSSYLHTVCSNLQFCMQVRWRLHSLSYVENKRVLITQKEDVRCAVYNVQECPSRVVTGIDGWVKQTEVFHQGDGCLCEVNMTSFNLAL